MKLSQKAIASVTGAVMAVVMPFYEARAEPQPVEPTHTTTQSYQLLSRQGRSLIQKVFGETQYVERQTHEGMAAYLRDVYATGSGNLTPAEQKQYLGLIKIFEAFEDSPVVTGKLDRGLVLGEKLYELLGPKMRSATFRSLEHTLEAPITDPRYDHLWK